MATWRQRQRLEWCIHKAKECWVLVATSRSQAEARKDSTLSLRVTMALPLLSLGLLASSIVGEHISIVPHLSVCGTWFPQPLEAHSWSTCLRDLALRFSLTAFKLCSEAASQRSSQRGLSWIICYRMAAASLHPLLTTVHPLYCVVFPPWPVSPSHPWSMHACVLVLFHTSDKDTLETG